MNGEAISDPEFGEIHDRVERTAQQLLQAGKLPWHPSFFEMLTVMAFEYFASMGVEIAVLEVGMGGRLDATNVVDPMISVIADIALDHQKYLGDTIAEIAGEKAGIIRNHGVVVTLPQHPQANDVIGHAIEEKTRAESARVLQYVHPVSPGAAAYRAGRKTNLAGRSRYPLAVMGEEIEVDSPLVGRHGVAQHRISDRDGGGGQSFRVQGNAETDGARDSRNVLAGTLSGAAAVSDHVPARNGARRGAQSLGAWALRSALSENFAGRGLTFVFAALQDKAIQEIAEILFPIAEQVVVTRVGNPRAATTAELVQAGSRTGALLFAEETVPAALARAREISNSDGLIVVTGSIFLVGEAMAAMGIES